MTAPKRSRSAPPIGWTRRERLERVSDRIRTGDRRDHNAELYQLSYAHHVKRGRPRPSGYFRCSPPAGLLSGNGLCRNPAAVEPPTA